MRIALLVCPNVQLLDVVGPTDVFAEACRQLCNSFAYRLQVISTADKVVRSSSGLSLLADSTLATHRGAIDTLLVAGSPDIEDELGDEGVNTWLRKQARQVRRIGSVCSGAFVLGAAGLLKGRRVATHWNFAARLSERYPETEVDADAIYVCDGNFYTSAGVTAGMDLALALVEQGPWPRPGPARGA